MIKTSSNAARLRDTAFFLALILSGFSFSLFYHGGGDFILAGSFIGLCALFFWVCASPLRGLFSLSFIFGLMAVLNRRNRDRIERRRALVSNHDQDYYE